MRCDRFEQDIAEWLDSRLTAAEGERMRAHARNCPACGAKAQRLREVRGMVRALPRLTPPAELKAQLRVIASHERVRLASRVTVLGWLAHCYEQIRFSVNNLMRPVAIPAAGGILSAVLLFALIAPSLAVGGIPMANDVPTILYIGASVKAPAPVGFESGEVVIELTIDEQGRMVDYKMPGFQLTTAQRRNLENHLLLTQFNPALSFGKASAGKIFLTLRSSSIDVKG